MLTSNFVLIIVFLNSLSLQSLEYALKIQNVNSVKFSFFFYLLLIVLMFNFKKTEAVKSIRELRFFALFILWVMFSTIWTRMDLFVIKELSKYLYPVVVYVCINSLSVNSLHNKKFVSGIAAAGLLLGAASLGVNFIYKDFSVEAFLRGEDIERIGVVAGVFMSSPLLSTVCMVFFLPLRVSVLIRFLILVNAVYILGSLTRSYVLGAISGISVALISTRMRLNASKLLIFSAVILVASVFLLSIGPFKKRMVMVGLESEVNFMETPEALFDPRVVNWSGRILVWSGLLTDVFENKSALLGGGIGTTRRFMKQYESVSETFGKVIHGEWIKITADFGLIGVGLYLIFYLDMIRRLAGEVFVWQDSTAKACKAAALSGLVFIFIANIGYDVGTTIPGGLDIFFMFHALGNKVYDS